MMWYDKLFFSIDGEFDNISSSNDRGVVLY